MSKHGGQTDNNNTERNVDTNLDSPDDPLS